MPGQIVVITGTSGAGKTTTCQAFARRAADCYLLFGMDYLTSYVASKFTMLGERASEYFYDYRKDPVDPTSARIGFGAAGWRALEAMHEMIAAASRAGQNVVVDHLTWVDPPVLQDCIWRLKDAPVLFVALRPSYDVLMDRLASRQVVIPPSYAELAGSAAAQAIADRLQAVTPWFYAASYANERYDLVIDTTRYTPDEVCAQIEARLAAGPGTAFADLRESYPDPR